MFRIFAKSGGVAGGISVKETKCEFCMIDCPKVKSLKDRLEKAERERDVAVKDLESLCRDDVGPCSMAICEFCAYKNGGKCLSKDGRICDGYEIFNWKWRGQKEE